jgi:DNA polymerase V
MNSSELPARVARIERGEPGGHAPARSRVAIGFGSPADDTGVTRLDLNDILVKNPQATFLMRVTGTAMHEAGIDDGDVVLIDRAITPAHGHIVIAVIDEDFYCRRLHTLGGEVRLRAAAPTAVDVVPGDGQELRIWGVVTHAIKSMPL